jgi:hypothetical protein
MLQSPERDIWYEPEVVIPRRREIRIPVTPPRLTETRLILPPPTQRKLLFDSPPRPPVAPHSLVVRKPPKVQGLSRLIRLPPADLSPPPSLVSDETYESVHLDRPKTPVKTPPRPVPPTPMLRMRGGRPTPTPATGRGKRKGAKKAPVKPIKLPRLSERRPSRPRPKRKPRSGPKKPPVPKKRPVRTKIAEQPRPRPRRRQATRVSKRPRTKDLAGLKGPSFSIQKTGNRYILSAQEVTDSVMSQVKAFLNRKSGQVYIDNEKMSKPAALRYLSANLGKKRVQVVFRRK